MKMLFLKISQYSQENTYVGVSFLIKLQISGLLFYEKETTAQMFCCEYYEIFKSTYFEEHLRTATSKSLKSFPN